MGKREKLGEQREIFIKKKPKRDTPAAAWVIG